MLNEGTAGGSTAVEDRGPSLADDIGQMFGDILPSSSELPESSAGAPPDAAPDSPAVGSEGENGAEHAGAPPADAATDALDPAVEVTPLDDPLATATPLTYVVDGQERTSDFIKVLGDHGAIVPAEHLGRLQQRLSERDHLFEKDKANHEKYSALEKLTAWRTKDAQGQEVVLTGHAGLEAQRVVLVDALERARTFGAALDDPKTFATLYEIVTDEAGQYGPAGQQYVIPNKEGIERLKREASINSREATLTARAHFSKLSAPAVAPTATETPVSEVALATVEATAKSFGVNGLTAEDKQFLADQLPKYVRPTTPEEKRQGLGTRVVDGSFGVLVKREAARIASTSKIATSATDAATSNATRIAAALVGSRKPGTPAARTPKPPTPQDTRQSETDDLWDMNERAAATAIRRRA